MIVRAPPEPSTDAALFVERVVTLLVRRLTADDAGDAFDRRLRATVLLLALAIVVLRKGKGGRRHALRAASLAADGSNAIRLSSVVNFTPGGPCGRGRPRAARMAPMTATRGSDAMPIVKVSDLAY